MLIQRVYYFYIDGQKLRMRIKWCNSKCITSFSLPCKIEPTKWDVKKQRCKQNTFHFGISSSEINKEIAHYEELANSIFEDFSSTPTVVEFKNKFLTKIGKNKHSNSTPINLVFDDFLMRYSKSNDLQDRTIFSYNSLFKWIKKCDFIKTTDDLTDENIEMLHEMFVKKQIKNSSIKQLLSLLKTFIKWINKNYDKNINTEFNIKTKTTNNDLIYLEWEELLKIYNYDFNDEILNYTRDLFCFCSFTSLRISDAMKLKRDEIYDDYLLLVTKKTSKPIKIEFNNYSRSIIEKYKDDKEPFNKLGLTTFNIKIKEIGRICGIDSQVKRIYYSGSKRIEKTVSKYKLLSSHCGRRTFVVHCIRLGIPIEIIMRWTGHANYNTLKNYVDIVDEVKQSSMDKFNL